jgi:acetoin utilization deacetylase AcuC-like enzyme
VQVIYSPRYELDLGAHVWPTSKYRLIAQRLEHGGTVPAGAFTDPEPCTWDDLALVHTAEYLAKIRNDRLTRDDIRTLELPWRRELADGFRLMTGGTCLAADAALRDGASVHLGGGLHHAFAGHGEGFCLFNDVAVAIRSLQRDRRISRAAVVDCDVHHGNGTAMIFERDESVFTFSIHQQHNYPIVKPCSSLDIGLADGTRDDEYLARLGPALDAVVASAPEIVMYLAGADPFREDRLGGLALTHEGLRARDSLVFETMRRAGVPVAVVLAGGYAADPEDTVRIHVQTVHEVLKDRGRSITPS